MTLLPLGRLIIRGAIAILLGLLSALYVHAQDPFFQQQREAQERQQRQRQEQEKWQREQERQRIERERQQEHQRRDRPGGITDPKADPFKEMKELEGPDWPRPPTNDPQPGGSIRF